MNKKAIMIYVCLILWEIYGIAGILKNYSQYSFFDWIIVLFLLLFPYVLAQYVTKKIKKSTKRNPANLSEIPQNTSQQILSNNNQYTPSTQPSAKIINKQSNVHSSNLSNPLMRTIPEDVLSLLWIKNINCEFQNEPSMIDTTLPIINDPSAHLTELDYYPNYAKLTPYQRYRYLSWLKDITQPIDIGYVFIFYYGLERHLFFGDFENAYKTIKILQHHHNNNSFQRYSSDALLMSIAYHKRIDMFESISFDNLDVPVKFYLKQVLNIGVSADDVIDSCRKFGFTNTRYIKENRKLFKELLEDTLYKQYGQKFLLFTDDVFYNCSANCPLVLANYSLHKRIASIPDITTNKHVSDRIFCILSSVHEEFKALKKANRKKDS